MTLYFENPVNFAEADTITTDEIWHPLSPLLAVASYSQERGGFVTIFDELVRITLCDCEYMNNWLDI